MPINLGKPTFGFNRITTSDHSHIEHLINNHDCLFWRPASFTPDSTHSAKCLKWYVNNDCELKYRGSAQGTSAQDDLLSLSLAKSTTCFHTMRKKNISITMGTKIPYTYMHCHCFERPIFMSILIPTLFPTNSLLLLTAFNRDPLWQVSVCGADKHLPTNSSTHLHIDKATANHIADSSDHVITVDQSQSLVPQECEVGVVC